MVYQPLLLVISTASVDLWGSPECLLLLMCVAAVVYYCYAMYAAVKFFSQPVNFNTGFQPPISILKPICGVDSTTYENLASFCQQDYPDYQIIFGVQDLHDSGLKVVKQIIRDFPLVDIQFVITDRPLGANLKVGNLANTLVKAKSNILLLADCDVQVQPNYLQQVVQPLSNPNVGVVTCLYRSLAQGWVAALEALSTTTEFHPGVLVSNQLEGAQFAMGQTIVIRRSVLEEIGGFEGIADYLADDFQLGYRAAKAGYNVVLSHHIIEHVLPACTLIDSLQRQIRWMLVIRVSRPWGYAGLIFTYGTVSSLLFLLLTQASLIGWIVLATTWTIRLVMAWFVGVKHLHDPVAKRLLWLVPLRDCLSFALWGYGFLCNIIKWRDHPFKLTKDGEMVGLTMQELASRVPSTPI
jgi:ceramide glucosyltransferase